MGVADPEVCPLRQLLHMPFWLPLSETTEDSVRQELDSPSRSGQLTALVLQEKRCSWDWHSLKVAQENSAQIRVAGCLAFREFWASFPAERLLLLAGSVLSAE